jgi:two-component system, NtrC family, response regulator HupR/HoxA
MQNQRALRRHVRVHCQVRAGQRVFDAVTTNVSESGVALRARLPRDSAPVPGDSIEIEPNIEDRTPLRAVVVWSDAGEQDIDGAEVCGIGARFADSAPVAALITHADLTQHAVLLVCTDPVFIDDATRWLDGIARVLVARTLADAMNLLLSDSISAIVCDESMPYPGASDFLATVRECFPRAPWVRVVTGSVPDTTQLTELINVARVFHFFHKPIEGKDFRASMQLAINQSELAVDNDALRAEIERTNQRLERENAYLRRRVSHSEPSRMLGQAPAFLEVMRDLERVASFDTTVHLSGETGTGKELAARAIHAASRRAGGPFVVQNCGGMTETLLQSALFGHKRGSFTGAERDRPGVFQEANGGTLFLDEVAELAPQTQAMLLRALQSGEVVPVGATKPERVNVRIVSATHKDLREEVQAGRVREDLFYRLVVVELHMPALRERPEDVRVLAQHFYDELCQRYGRTIEKLDDAVLNRLSQHAWPGNIRELENEIERLVVMQVSSGRVVKSLPASPPIITKALPPSTRKLSERVAEFEAQILQEALVAHHGNKSQAAKALGIPRQTLLDHLKRRGVH